MKRPSLLIAILLVILSHNVNAQQSSYQLDLEFLYRVLQKTPSYEDQITGAQESSYRQYFERLANAPVPATALDTFYSISKLLWPIKDRHISFYQFNYLSNNLNKLNDSAFLKTYSSSAEFKNHPRVNVNLDSLEAALSKKSKEDIEGIYSIGNLSKVGIYRTSKRDSLIGVILGANLRTWVRGQLYLVAKETSPKVYRTIFYNIYTKGLNFSENSKFIIGKMQYYDLQKTGVPSYADYRSEQIYSFKQLNADIQYLYLGSFMSSNQNLAVAKRFYNSIKDSLTAKSLIVDLRGNGGGGSKCSNQFYAMLNDYSKQHKIYVLVNGTVCSMAERFALRLKSLKNTILFGEATNGKIAYGANRDNTLTLPSGRFRVYVTDMKDPANYLQYEEIGVKPDIYLNNESDWLKQVLTYAEKHG